jgi:hypothetical protein
MPYAPSASNSIEKEEENFFIILHTLEEISPLLRFPDILSQYCKGN